MGNNSIGIAGKKPVSAWNKPLKVDFKTLFKSLTKAVGHGVTGNWLQLSQDAAEMATAVGFEKDVAQVTWLLIYRSLTKAIFSLVSENADLLSENIKEISDDYIEKLTTTLEDSDWGIDPDFFTRPQDLKLLNNVKVSLTDFLIGCKLKEAQANTLSNRLPSYFIYALNSEWRLNPILYGPIKDALDTPFTKAGEKEQAWNNYYSWLQLQVDESIFDETFGLRQVYIPLRAYKLVKEKEEPDADKSESHISREKGFKKHVIKLEDELNSWLDKKDKDDAIRVISGGPGSGKSSYAKMLSADLAQKNCTRFIFLPLHKFDPKGDLVESIGDFVKSTEILPYNPADPESTEEHLILIFDGLDELSMQGKIAAETASNFIREIFKTVSSRNYRNLRLQVILSGRTLSIQSNENEFRKPGQILHLLPYYLSKDAKEEYDDPNNLLNDDQRQLWWNNYGEISGKGYDGIPKEFLKEDLDEITSQPLLNYLVALSYSREKLDFSKEINRNVIFEDLLKAVYERAYEGRIFRGIEELKEDYFIRILEEIGIATWHGDGRTTTVYEINKHCERSGLSRYLNAFQDGTESGVTKLLTAFYFRQYGTSIEGEKTFEFTHKSFGEYLTAKRIMRALEKMHVELNRQIDNPDYGWNIRNALKHWVEVCGPTTMDNDLYRFVSDEIKLLTNSTIVNYQNMIRECISYLLEHGIPFEDIPNRPSFFEETRQSRNAEESLLATHYSCASIIDKVSDIKWPDSTSAGSWIAKLGNQRWGVGKKLALYCLGYLNFEGKTLHINDLYDTNLTKANLKRTGCIFTNFVRANLERANFEGADLAHANLTLAKLEEADLNGANLREAKLEEADLNGANLREAKLERADLARANLTLAKLEKADLSGANLREAKLEEANLEGANLEGANLVGVNLKKAINVDKAIGIDPKYLEDSD